MRSTVGARVVKRRTTHQHVPILARRVGMATVIILVVGSACFGLILGAGIVASVTDQLADRTTIIGGTP